MRLHYQRANPDTGGESFLLRFEEVCSDRIACLLVNSGRGVDVDDLLDESRGEYLMGIVVNNAHPECYCTLGKNARDDVPIYVTHQTAQIVATALTGPHARTIEQPETVLEQMVVVDGWHQFVDGVQLHPVPVGHAPGAAGFLFEITDGKRYRTLFIADEYTVRQAGGYPGVSLDLDIEIDAMIVTDAVDQPVQSALTEACSIICERANTGSTVLITADEPTGLHVAGLLGRLDQSRSVTILGRIATLWEEFGYSAPNVTIDPEDRLEALSSGSIAVATPTTPVQGLSGRLFEELSDDPEAMVVRLTHGEATPMSASQCMVQSLPWQNLPTRDTLSTVIDAFNPVQVVVADRNATDDRGVPACDSFVWCIDDDLVYTLFDGARWVAPAEVDPDTEHRIRNRVSDRYEEPLLSEHGPSIPLSQYSEQDLVAEGIDAEAINEQIQDPPTQSETPEQTATPMAPPVVSDTTAESSATDGGTTSIGVSLAALNDQLTTVRSMIDGRTHRASVVDAGDGVYLFRVQDPPAAFEHGQEVSLLVAADKEHGLNQRQKSQRQAETEHTAEGDNPETDSEPSDVSTEAV
ncbi:MBL fold metallo-hydrolase [Halocatena pleomorpha]|uniref:Uncharacterized protein n=1 Tax=Halocatena pleomorpha TaxID=1785090 RepID=A0A3P3RFM0_9EURY|nr:hypothetical protein [Halocatena pleomorpha]RRJ32201.1 hypothetical protein EIK79_05395 [Halocatena pleomorpha]